ncbi:MAG: hypothetical protein H6Q84_1607 [Deltaproteobacteria bacterium]|nr:hypothetical protein [Deltaproteobacteria bacterium]
MFLGVSPIVAYQTMSNMYMVLGDRVGAADALRKGFEETEEPFFRERLRQLEESPGRNPYDQNRKR